MRVAILNANLNMSHNNLYVILVEVLSRFQSIITLGTKEKKRYSLGASKRNIEVIVEFLC